MQIEKRQENYNNFFVFILFLVETLNANATSCAMEEKWIELFPLPFFLLFIFCQLNAANKVVLKKKTTKYTEMKANTQFYIFSMMQKFAQVTICLNFRFVSGVRYNLQLDFLDVWENYSRNYGREKKWKSSCHCMFEFFFKAAEREKHILIEGFVTLFVATCVGFSFIFVESFP